MIVFIDHVAGENTFGSVCVCVCVCVCVGVRVRVRVRVCVSIRRPFCLWMLFCVNHLTFDL